MRWLQHDILGKFLSNLTLVLLLWSKWAISKYCIYYWFANKYVPDYMENYFGLSPKLDVKGYILELTIKSMFLLVITNFLRAAYGDPGYVHLMKFTMPQNLFPDKLEKTCLKCNNRWKPPRAHHCKVCTKCILRMDHHCAWIGNCVGARNQKFFILFLLYTVLYSLAGLAICIMNLILWLMEYGKESRGYANYGWGTVNKIFLAIGAVFFLLFAFDFMWEQFEAVIENQTTVETYKNMVGRPGTFFQNMEKVFGKNKWAWLLPFTPKIEVNALELLYYEIEITGDQKGKGEYTEDEFKKLPFYKRYFI